MDENITSAIQRLKDDKFLDGAIRMYEKAIEKAKDPFCSQTVIISLELANDALMFMKELKDVREYLCDVCENQQKIEKKIDDMLKEIRSRNR